MSEKAVIIIGAGLAGLSAGCYAQMNGYRSHILEHHRAPGGVAACWRRGDFLIDGGIHFLMGHRPGTLIYDLYCELGTTQANQLIEMTVYGQFLDQASGRSLLVTTDLERLRSDLVVLFPKDAQLIDDLVDRSLAFRGLDWDQMGMGKPPELTGPWDTIRMLWDLRRSLRFLVGRHARTVREYAQSARDPWLRWILQYMFLPEVPAWFLFMVLGMVADGQLALLEGGSQDFVQALERRYAELGGQVTYRATVEKILVESDRAVGVRLADGTTLPADAVISAADGASTIHGMLDGRYLDRGAETRFSEWPLIRPLVMASYGVNRQFCDAPWLQMIRLEHPIELGEHRVEEIILRIFNYSHRFAPAGKTVIQASLETEWDYWHDLRADKQRYREAKKRVAAALLDRLEPHFHGLSEQVEVTDVATPYTTYRYTRNHRGAYMGWLPTPQTIMTTIPRTLPGLHSFLMAGQWVTPGGGVPTSLLTGRHAVQILCRQDGRAFKTSLP